MKGKSRSSARFIETKRRFVDRICSRKIKVEIVIIGTNTFHIGIWVKKTLRININS